MDDTANPVLSKERSFRDEGIRPLVIAGMHRSGTSLIANYLSEAGLHLGARLLPADAGNPRGYFENETFLEFHNQILSRNKCGYFFRSTEPKIETNSGDVRKAAELASQFSGHRQWAWKDPRTTLFLDLWERALDRKAFYLLIFRQPLAVVNSLLRRGTDPEILRRPEIALASYLLYNRALYAHFLRCPERCLLVALATAVEKPQQLISQLVNRFGLDLDTNTPFSGVYHSTDLTSHDHVMWKSRQTFLTHPVMAFQARLLYRDLKHNATLRPE